MPESIDWRIVALSSEIGDAPLSGRLTNGDIVLFRDAAARCHAMLDRCAHNRAPPFPGYGATRCA